jgi:hypothetical protein
MEKANGYSFSIIYSMSLFLFICINDIKILIFFHQYQNFNV